MSLYQIIWKCHFLIHCTEIETFNFSNLLCSVMCNIVTLEAEWQRMCWLVKTTIIACNRNIEAYKKYCEHIKGALEKQDFFENSLI